MTLVKLKPAILKLIWRAKCCPCCAALRCAIRLANLHLCCTVYPQIYSHRTVTSIKWLLYICNSSSLVLTEFPLGIAGRQQPTNVPCTNVIVLSLHYSWLLHGVRTGLHVVQVVLGYMLMLCVMSYNVWIFLGVIVGSLLGYFLAFPLSEYVM